MTSARDFGLTVVRSSGSEENVICPFHSDSSPSASYNRAKGMFYCYVCSLGLNSQQLAERLGIDLDEEFNYALEDFDLLDSSEPLELGSAMVSNDYLFSRKIGMIVARGYGLRYLEGENPAIILPVVSLKGKLTGTVYRYIHPRGSRYSKHGTMTPVWPMPHLLDTKPGQYLIVTEGAFSAMRLATAWGIVPGVLPVALLGAKANQGILDALAPFRPIFLYDNDEAGRRACQKMREIAPLTKAFVLDTSPDDCSDEQLEQLKQKVHEVINSY